MDIFHKLISVRTQTFLKHKFTEIIHYIFSLPKRVLRRLQDGAFSFNFKYAFFLLKVIQ